MQPTRDNLAVNSLPEPAQTRNIRKVKVNAQVTFIIYILETIANFSIFVIWFFINKRNSTMTMTLGIMWFHVILPYTFLMNTSHNKRLVTDEGWWNTIRNTLRLPDISDTSDQNGTSISIIYDVKKHNNKRHSDRALALRSGKSKNHSAFESQKSSDEIYSISKSIELECETENEYLSSALNVYSVPSTSKNSRMVTDQIEERIVDAFMLRQSIQRKEAYDSDEDCPKNPRKSQRICIGEKILKDMTKNIHNEAVYVHYLNQLSIFEDGCRKKTKFCNEFQVVHFNEVAPRKINSIKNPKKQSKVNQRHMNEKGKSHSVPSSTLRDRMIHIDLVQKSLDIIEMRKSWLDDFEQYCCDEDTYNNFLNMLFDFEENLL